MEKLILYLFSIALPAQCESIKDADSKDEATTDIITLNILSEGINKNLVLEAVAAVFEEEN